MNNDPWRASAKAAARGLHSRARTVITPSGGIVRGKFASRKNGRSIHYEGLLEQEALYLLEACPSVTAYWEQPVTIPYPNGDLVRRYTPDLKVHLRTDEMVYIEVKPRRSLLQPEVASKLKAVGCHFERSAQRFELLLDDDIRQQPRLSNLKWIYHQVPRTLPTAQQVTFELRRLGGRFPMSIGQAARELAGTKVDPFSLLLMGECRCDLTQPLSLDTQIHLASESTHAEFLVSSRLGF